MRARDHANLVLQLTEHLESLGAVRTPDGIYAFRLPTPVGNLHIAIDTEIKVLICIFGRFDEPQRAALRLGVGEVNQYSGKWNHYYPKIATAESVFDDFRASLARVFVQEETR